MPDLQPPQPAVTDGSSERQLWGETTVDPHHWLIERDRPEVLEHLQAENAYAEAVLAPTSELQETLFEEIRSRVKETDLSIPIVEGGWAYYSRTEEGRPYALHCRRPAPPDADLVALAAESAVAVGPLPGEFILLDENLEAGVAVNGPAGSAETQHETPAETPADEEPYYDLGAFEVSPDHRLLVWSEDRTGDERYTVRFRDLESGEVLDDVLSGVSAGSAWAADNATLFYVRPDESNRPYQVWRHRLGTPESEDVLVFTEDDERFYCGVGRDRDDRFLWIGSSSAVTDEVWFLPADTPDAPLRCVEPRRQGVEYAVSQVRGRLIILTNDDAVNFRLASTSVEATGREHWIPLVDERSDVMLTGFDAFGSHLVLFERSGGALSLSTRRWDCSEAGVTFTEPARRVEQDEAVHTVWAGANTDSEARSFRYGYSSMVTPPAIYLLDLDSGERTLVRQTEVLGDFDPGRYRTDRTWATAEDGTLVPISLVWRADRPSSPGPCLLTGYGAYEISLDPVFSSARISLLDRGFVVAVAHVRGGGEMGRRWYLDGKFEKKQNSFSDLVACARHLVDSGWTNPDALALRGGSAGGLLVGAAMNLAPELFRAVIAQVPFVDALNTMLDASLPLTTGEWEEWGNPAESESVYAAMRAYSPYENVTSASYPAVLATAGFTDPRVGYWEPAKWVLKLRECTTSGHPILLWTDLGAGHGGPSGRYGAWRDEARLMAFTLWSMGTSC